MGRIKRPINMMWPKIFQHVNTSMYTFETVGFFQDQDDEQEVEIAFNGIQDLILTEFTLLTVFQQKVECTNRA